MLTCVRLHADKGRGFLGMDVARSEGSSVSDLVGSSADSVANATDAHASTTSSNSSSAQNASKLANATLGVIAKLTSANISETTFSDEALLQTQHTSKMTYNHVSNFTKAGVRCRTVKTPGSRSGARIFRRRTVKSGLLRLTRSH